MAQPKTLEDAWSASKARGNNFDALRLAAAFAVIISHSFEIVGGAPESEPLRILTAGDSSLGRIAVMTFFVLSGFLLTKSWLAEPALAAFVKKRVSRIAPALFAVVLICVLILGPALSTSPATSYFADGAVWRYLANLGFYTKFDGLPGVFASTPIAGVVNGPLWTLKFEVMCYATLAIIGVCGLLKPRIVFALMIAFYLADAAYAESAQAGLPFYAQRYFDLARPFFAGAIFALMATRIALTVGAALLSAAALLIAAPFGLFGDAFPLFGGYLVLWFGFAPLGCVARAGRLGDFSYGLYLWGWPAQQIVQQAFEPSSWLANAALAAPLALGAAVLSWKLVEKPALALKAKKLSRSSIRKSPAGGPKPLPSAR